MKLNIKNFRVNLDINKIKTQTKNLGIDEESIKQFAIDLQKADNLKEIVQIGTK